jgi:uncharacterized protein (TIGR02145 family)
MEQVMNDGDVIGTFTDERDGQTYRTVKMPDGKVWMAQNLNYKPESGNSWCYKNDESMGDKYGRLYDWKTAMAVSPAGWHLPSRKEWNKLEKAVGNRITKRLVSLENPAEEVCIFEYCTSTRLKAKSGWTKIDDLPGNGTDDFGFSALPCGIRDLDGRFSKAGFDGHWWTAAEGTDGYTYHRCMDCYSGCVHDYYGDKGYGFSVRCIANK